MPVIQTSVRPEFEAADRGGVGDEFDRHFAAGIDRLAYIGGTLFGLRVADSGHLAEHVIKRHQRPAERKARSRHDQKPADQAPIGALSLCGIETGRVGIIGCHQRWLR